MGIDANGNTPTLRPSGWFWVKITANDDWTAGNWNSQDKYWEVCGDCLPFDYVHTVGPALTCPA